MTQAAWNCFYGRLVLDARQPGGCGYDLCLHQACPHLTIAVNDRLRVRHTIGGAGMTRAHTTGNPCEYHRHWEACGPADLTTRGDCLPDAEVLSRADHRANAATPEPRSPDGCYFEQANGHVFWSERCDRVARDVRFHCPESFFAHRVAHGHPPDFTGLAAARLGVPDGRRPARRDAPKGRPGPRLGVMVAALRDKLALDAALSLEETIDAAHKQLGIVDVPDGAGLRRKAELAYHIVEGRAGHAVDAHLLRRDAEGIVAKGTASCVAFCFLVGSPTHQSLLPKRPRLWHAFFREGTRKGLAHVVRLHTAMPVGEILSGAAAKRDRVRLGAEIFDFFRERCSDRTVSTSWGGVGLVRATLVLWRDAIAQDPSVTHFALLSDSCVPLAGFESVWRVVAGLERTMIRAAPLSLIHI